MKNSRFLDQYSKLRQAFSKFSVSKIAKFTSIAPLVIFVVALIVIIALGATTGSYSNGVGIGIDFEGGTVLTVTLGEEAENNYDANRTEIVQAIQSHGVTVSYVQKESSANVSKTAISFRYKNISQNDDEINALNEEIKASVAALYDTTTIPSFQINYESIGATAATDLLSKAGIALAVSIVLILIYIIIRFEFVSAVSAIVCLAHDVVMMFLLTVICRVQINSSYVAAMITIIAYSINNTIIIFDRCREEIKPLKGQNNKPYNQIGDMAVRETMTRSIYTTLTTLIMVVFLAALGSESLREFCVPIILGLIAGFVSSVFFATPLWAVMSVSFDKTKEKIRAKRANKNAVSYEKSDEDEQVKSNEVVKEVAQAPKKQNTNPQNGRAVYKYKKQTSFKKK